MYQKFIAIGNVGKDDATLRYLPSGDCVANWSLAVNKRVGKGDDRRDVTTWFKCSMWGERASKVCQYITRGKKLGVEGEVSVEVYLNREGKPAASLVIRINQVILLGERNDTGGGNAEDPFDSHTTDADSDLPF